jgi:hypothetical protein
MDAASGQMKMTYPASADAKQGNPRRRVRRGMTAGKTGLSTDETDEEVMAAWGCDPRVPGLGHPAGRHLFNC